MNKDVGFEMQSVHGLNLEEENDQLMNIVNESTIMYEVGLNGKPVINTITQESNHDISIDTNYLQSAIENSVVGQDCSSKVAAFREKQLKIQLEKQKRL